MINKRIIIAVLFTLTIAVLLGVLVPTIKRNITTARLLAHTNKTLKQGVKKNEIK